MAELGGPEHPYVFRAAVGGFMGPAFSVEWQGEDLVYESWDRGSQTGWIKARPTPTRWRRFWDKCDEVNVCQRRVKTEHFPPVENCAISIA